MHTNNFAVFSPDGDKTMTAKAKRRDPFAYSIPYPVLLPSEAITILKNMDESKWGADLHIRKEMAKLRGSKLPNNRDLYTLVVMHSTRAWTNYSSNALAVKSILHREVRLPWTEQTDTGIVSMWRLTVINRSLCDTTQQYVKEVIQAVSETLHVNVTSPTSSIDHNRWNDLMLDYACLATLLYVTAMNASENDLEYYFPRWGRATDRLLEALDDRDEMWARILRCRIAINYLITLDPKLELV